ncbi:kinesin-like nuclear fusion protein [Xanthoria parietina]
MEHDSENAYASRLPQLQSKIRMPSPVKGTFGELSASSMNARNAAMPPPAKTGTKRKTLAEQGGEPRRAPQPPSINGTTIAGTKPSSWNGPYRQPSTSSSVASSRPSSVASSRNISSGSFAGPMSTASRPPSAQSQRPQSAMAASKIQRPHSTHSRSVSSLNTHPSQPGAGGIHGQRSEFDVGDRLERMESVVSDFKSQLTGVTTESDGLRETIGIYKARVMELETTKTQLEAKYDTLNADLCTSKAELTSCRSELTAASHALEDLKRSHKFQGDDLQRQHQRELEESRRQAQEQIYQSERKHTTEREDLKRQLERALEEERTHHRQELQTVTSVKAKSQEQLEAELERQRKQQESLEEEVRKSRTDLACERDLNSDLRTKVSQSASSAISLESSIRSLRAHVEFLESDNKSQSNAFSDLDNRLQNAIKAAEEAKEKLRTEETLRRKLHNQVQELKGNIRVFCRVRPSLKSDPNDAIARINYPDSASDSKEVEVCGPEEKNSLGKTSTKTNAFSFDRVFAPGSVNAEVFGEISQLVQSALDGYNVCIFCYGQTGSGKTFTMSAQDGMIPRAVNQIYDTAKSLEEKGWKYTMEGSFIEVYNENINDLLGKPDELDKKKHEIRHDMQKCKTTITGINTVDLDSPNKVESILQSAASNRSVAATKANERSSRSHSVFILKLTGENSTTGEKSEGTLNLVDLAGSERLSHSQAAGERLKETQSINKSLSCLGDVIGALGQGKDGGHVPYRNSKLTYLLQFSLGGNSKTLMFVMISPLQAHLNETLTSLKFATKVHNTHIGTAKRQAKVRDS